MKLLEMKHLAQIFKALSDEKRLAIFQFIREQCGPGCQVPEEQIGRCVSEAAKHVNLALSTASHHLKELRNAGLIHCEKRSQWVYCTPDKKVLKQIVEFLKQGAA